MLGIKKLAASLFVTALSLTALASCDGGGGSSNPPTIAVTKAELEPGGVYIAYMNNVGKCSKGCDQLEKGDLILEVGGRAVTTAKDTRNSQIATGEPVKLKVYKKSTKAAVEVEVVAQPTDQLPPLKDQPPFYTVGAAELNRAPEWARRTLFAHASPATMLVNADGGILTGRDLVGKKRLIVFWDIATRDEQAASADIMQVLQLAQADLTAAGVDIMFTQIQFPSNLRQQPWNDSSLRQFQEQQGRKDVPPLALYRFPNATEYNAAKEVGLEGATTYIQYFRAPPAIIILDENGIVRWHSEGIQKPPDGHALAEKPNQYTIIEAIEFAKTQL
ncbi:MAG: hypothetical protein R3B09_28550 [Nannocystaceae bacterium]